MDEELKHVLLRVEKKLDAIRDNTKTTWKELLLAGVLRGAGLIVGAALTLALAGWGLTILGVIPGAEDMAEYLTDLIEDATSATQ